MNLIALGKPMHALYFGMTYTPYIPEGRPISRCGTQWDASLITMELDKVSCLLCLKHMRKAGLEAKLSALAGSGCDVEQLQRLSLRCRGTGSAASRELALLVQEAVDEIRDLRESKSWAVWKEAHDLITSEGIYGGPGIVARLQTLLAVQRWRTEWMEAVHDAYVRDIQQGLMNLQIEVGNLDRRIDQVFPPVPPHLVRSKVVKID